MSRLGKAGGIAALIEAAAFIFGLALALTVLAPFAMGSLDAAGEVAYIAENTALMVAWNQIIYIVFGAFLVVLTVALHERLRERTPALTKIAASFGLIWAGLVIASGMVFNVGAKVVVELMDHDPILAMSTWSAVSTVQDGLGGGNEIVGGLWILILGIAGLKARAFGTALNVLGIVIGAVGVVTILPFLGEIGGMIFGFGSIVWFVWIGIAMLRNGA